VAELVLDSGGVSFLAERSESAAAYIRTLIRRDLWPPVVPSAVLVECLQGDAARDARTNRLLSSCDVRVVLSLELARRAAQLRTAARTGSAVDAIVVATAEPGGIIATSDSLDISALAGYADGVSFDRV
jgi:hypothetical protein